MKIASSILLVFAVLLIAPKATAETGPWQTVPENGIISKPGRYLVDHDIITDRTTGIKIDADDVTLDLGGHAVRYTGEPKPGSFGIASPGRKRIAVYNGTIGNFWFNMHCTQNEKLRIRDLHFDNIPYIGVNVAQSNDVVISDNRFDNFRYDLPKDEINHYLVAINIGAKSAVITNNQFTADPQMAASDVDIETVCVLFSAEVTKECLVAKNVIEASDVLPKSYGIWLASNGQATIVDNTIRNMKYGVCLAGNASALVGYNRFNAESKSNPPIETIGISASGAKEVLNIKNSFEGVNVPVTAPPTKDSAKTTGG